MKNTVERILDGCVLLENWEGANGSRGKSFSYYSSTTEEWHQKWVDNFGQALEFSGTTENDQVVFLGISNGPFGAEILNEMTIKKVSNDEVTQLWRLSPDEGKTWTIAFGGVYHRIK